MFWRNVGEKFLLLIIIPGLFFLFLEGIIRISGIDVETIHNKRFDVGLPDWLITNEDWVFFSMTHYYRIRRYYNLHIQAGPPK